MNNKAVSPVTIFFYLLVFVIFYALFLGKWLRDSGIQMIENNHVTGIEALFYANLNWVVLIVVLCFILAAGAISWK